MNTKLSSFMGNELTYCRRLLVKVIRTVTSAEKSLVNVSLFNRIYKVVN